MLALWPSLTTRSWTAPFTPKAAAFSTTLET